MKRFDGGNQLSRIFNCGGKLAEKELLNENGGRYVQKFELIPAR